VLSNDELRKQYDKFGKDQAVPGGGFGKISLKMPTREEKITHTRQQRTRRSSSP
jgi:DnaJ-class molecular chaperone